MAPIREALTPDKAMQDAHGYLAWLSGNDLVAPGALATTGYCMGGRLALRTAATFGTQVAAAASLSRPAGARGVHFPVAVHR